MFDNVRELECSEMDIKAIGKEYKKFTDWIKMSTIQIRQLIAYIFTIFDSHKLELVQIKGNITIQLLADAKKIKFDNIFKNLIVKLLLQSNKENLLSVSKNNLHNPLKMINTSSIVRISVDDILKNKWIPS